MRHNKRQDLKNEVEEPMKNTGAETRLAVIEKTSHHLEKTLSELRQTMLSLDTKIDSHFKYLLTTIIIFSGALAGIMIHGFKWL